jgi:hypothetical protein
MDSGDKSHDAIKTKREMKKLLKICDIKKFVHGAINDLFNVEGIWSQSMNF